MAEDGSLVPRVTGDPHTSGLAVTLREIQAGVNPEQAKMVQNLVEHCLIGYLNLEQTIEALANERNIPPNITAFVWKTLEEKNPAFFAEYDIKLSMNKQIKCFNSLLKKHMQLIDDAEREAVACAFLSTGPNSSSMYQLSLPNASNIQLERINAYTSTSQQTMQVANGSLVNHGSSCAQNVNERLMAPSGAGMGVNLGDSAARFRATDNESMDVLASHGRSSYQNLYEGLDGMGMNTDYSNTEYGVTANGSMLGHQEFNGLDPSCSSMRLIGLPADGLLLGTNEAPSGSSEHISQYSGIIDVKDKSTFHRPQQS